MLLDKSNFLINPDITFLNHGSFGAVPHIVLDAQIEYRKEMESSPIEFFLHRAPELLEHSVSKLANLINANQESLFFVDNATNGVNTVLNSLLNYFNGNVEIVFFDQIYSAVKQSLNHLSKVHGIRLHEIVLDYPLSKDEIIRKFKEEISRCTKIAVFDHISSPTAMIFPVEELVEICSKMGIVTIVDGAHSVGQIPLDLSKFEYDFYISNCHKWLFAPKGSAFLWVNDIYKEIVHPLSISLFYGQGLRKEFYWQGTRDITQWLATADAIDFVNNIGLENLISHNNSLNYQAKKIIKDNFTEITCSDEQNAAMSTHFFSDDAKLMKLTGNEVRDMFFKKYKIEVPFMNYKNKMWFRISAQVYNTIDEYELLVTKLNQFVNKIKSGVW